MTDRGATTVHDDSSEALTHAVGGAKRAATTGPTPRTGTTTLPLPAPEMVLRSAEVEQTRRTVIAGYLATPAGELQCHVSGAAGEVEGWLTGNRFDRVSNCWRRRRDLCCGDLV